MHYCTPPKTRNFPLLVWTLVSHLMTAAFLAVNMESSGDPAVGVPLRAAAAACVHTGRVYSVVWSDGLGTTTACFNVGTKWTHGDVMSLTSWADVLGVRLITPPWKPSRRRRDLFCPWEPVMREGLLYLGHFWSPRPPMYPLFLTALLANRNNSSLLTRRVGSRRHSCKAASFTPSSWVVRGRCLLLAVCPP